MRRSSGGDVLRAAARDARYLVDRGYPKESAVRYVSDHYRLPEEERFVLIRAVVPARAALSRMGKRVPLKALAGREVMVDGYNVLITAESLLSGRPVYVCDDGFLRDAQGIFRSYRPSDLTDVALDEIIGLLASASPGQVEVLLDEQMSMSGRLADAIRGRMAAAGLEGGASTARDVDRRLKGFPGVVASGDGSIVDSAAMAVDIPGEMALQRGIQPLMI